LLLCTAISNRRGDVLKQTTKGHAFIDKAPSSEKKPETTSQLPAPNVSSIDLDSRYSKKENKEEKKLRKE
ncbi:hypothetical protein A2U01_0111566, partial [Trifolium medium]|nr:hypothetical protein [Trifolium medium]